ncbi:MAG TPA: FAD-binding oxidoreductase [Kofleriaceae bacterium]
MTELPRSVDVAIVGGGFAGMATAWWLAREGVTDVVVLEREPELGRYASGRSAGLGRQLAEDDLVTGLTVTGAAQLREHFSHVWTATGGILTFDTKEIARGYMARANRMGLKAARIKPEAVLKMWPQLAPVNIVAAIKVPSDGLIDIAVLLAGYAEGRRVLLDTAVERIEPEAGGARLWTSRGELAAKVVVDATGAWAGRTTGDPLLASFKRHVYVLEAVAPKKAPFVWHLGEQELYVRAIAGQILFSPCDAAPTGPGDQQPDEAGEAMLRSRLEGSPLANVTINRAWACQRTFSTLPAMKIQQDAERPWLVWVAGLGGHGATASSAVGQVAASYVISALGQS